jgi:ABC-type branched-subunit amino acid transport system permease subunit
MRTGRFKFLEVVFGRLDNCYEPLTGAIGFLTIIMRWGWHFFPFLPPLVPFLALLTVALVGAAWSPLVAVPALRCRAAPW